MTLSRLEAAISQMPQLTSCRNQAVRCSFEGFECDRDIFNSKG